MLPDKARGVPRVDDRRVRKWHHQVQSPRRYRHLDDATLVESDMVGLDAVGKNSAALIHARGDANGVRWWLRWPMNTSSTSASGPAP
jgi:hypothetical protein